MTRTTHRFGRLGPANQANQACQIKINLHSWEKSSVLLFVMLVHHRLWVELPQ